MCGLGGVVGDDCPDRRACSGQERVGKEFRLLSKSKTCLTLIIPLTSVSKKSIPLIHDISSSPVTVSSSCQNSCSSRSGGGLINWFGPEFHPELVIISRKVRL